MILSLGTFGTDEIGSILGVHLIATYDQRLINGYRSDWLVLSRRVRAMTAQLSPPFSDARLPFVAAPDELIKQQIHRFDSAE